MSWRSASVLQELRKELEEHGNVLEEHEGAVKTVLEEHHREEHGNVLEEHECAVKAVLEEHHQCPGGTRQCPGEKQTCCKNCTGGTPPMSWRNAATPWRNTNVL